MSKLNLKNSFTLIELIIVVLLIGLVYSIAIGFYSKKESVKIDDLTKLKEKLLSFKTEEKDKITFVMYDDCKKNAVLINNKPTYKDIDIDIDGNIEVYTIDMYGNLKRVEFLDILIDGKKENVCFRFNIFPNNSNNSYIVKLKNRYYIVKPYFEQIQTTSALNKAIDLYINEKLLPKAGNYYENE
jgi:Tfp pilus assembly major pilin PilA